MVAVVILNSFVSYWLARRGVGWRSAAVQFAVLLAINTGIVGAGHFVLSGGPITETGPSAFLLGLLTLLITLYDYFRPIYSARFETRDAGAVDMMSTPIRRPCTNSSRSNSVPL